MYIIDLDVDNIGIGIYFIVISSFTLRIGGFAVGFGYLNTF